MASTTTTSGKKDAAAIIASASRHTKPPQQPTFKNDNQKAIWCETQWTNLTVQARKLELPTLPYFDPETMLLSKEVNHKLWSQLGRLWDYLGPDRAPYATPVLLEGGEVRWHSYLNRDRGEEVEIYDRAVDAFMSESKRTEDYD
ncbi:uncharacterized protein Z518_00141 [Rhinocladiella mackenziei CBS 650.93]|uniref:Uncharacterized protein n=1 Tax=Rhinocladiella mackenziei CBS 650.93 TaxID=1442369 RepID=A0A0D2HEN3_9EURO|nr:uncharacterized protein Z518_00141 [Rhinocladiella mackenziei CBS 650.93]KIX09063.1 hypothetical protein Z518_00141 [Rhinocladiella mackenziei CBS 650.93]